MKAFGAKEDFARRSRLRAESGKGLKAKEGSKLEGRISSRLKAESGKELKVQG